MSPLARTFGAAAAALALACIVLFPASFPRTALRFRGNDDVSA